MLNKLHEQRIQALNNLIGYGNPSAKLWVFGIEEGCGWGDEKIGELRKSEGELEILKFLISLSPVYYTNEIYKKECPLAFDCNLKSLSKKGLYGAISRLLNIDVHSIGNWNENIFIGNLYPLSNKKYPDEYPSYYKKLFGISNRKEYIDSPYYKGRKNNLNIFFNKYFSKDKYLILFGKKLWSEYVEQLINNIDFFKKEEIILDYKNRYLRFMCRDGGLLVFSIHPACWKLFNLEEMKKYL